ncbi:flavin reductase family protein [Salinibacterium sp. dk2585]|uniref:flavin reductase family protein n=1 Tax=unclassified Salinibacterium TaxID=2632331 RepID=UPI0011C250BC|nr:MULTISPECIES: flavin reductase family protein [unclassified Salinibacterium]QEE60376.1 flavin reductase family protein [Salinibacterium sp. dk2585]TXK55449.1 flavin reductase family protein [Salinibacterium sp. dk5596]
MTATTTAQPPRLDTRAFRDACGRFPTGVTVISTPAADGRPAGMTANGFMSVSLDPALVVVSVGHNARTYERLMSNDVYAVSVLRHDQKDIASHFASREKSADPPFDMHNGHAFVPGAIARIGCRIMDRFPAGDHTLFLGEVETFDQTPEVHPLVFASGRLFSPIHDEEFAR